MHPYRSRNLHLQSFAELSPRLPPGNPISSAFQRSTKKAEFLSRPFFVYEGDIECDVLCMGLNNFHPNGLRYGLPTEPHIYPVVMGNLTVKSAYFDGYIHGDVTAKTLYLEHRMERIAAGCKGNLAVTRMFFIKRRRFEVGGKTSVHTLVCSNDAELASEDAQIKHRFDFPKIKRSTDFSRHTLAELSAHFDGYACGDGMDRVQSYYGQCLDAMLPVCNTASDFDHDYVLVDR